MEVSSNVIAKFEKIEATSIETLEKIAITLDTHINDSISMRRTMKL